MNAILNKVLVMTAAFAFTCSAFAKSATPGIDYLKNKSSDELAAIFADGTATEMPDGESIGYPVVIEQTPIINFVANRIWGGKVFDRETMTLTNKIGPFEAVSADLSIGSMAEALRTSYDTIPGFPFLTQDVYIDGKTSIIINYRESDTFAAREVIDELRKVKSEKYPNLYLGRATMFGRFALYFILEFPKMK